MTFNIEISFSEFLGFTDEEILKHDENVEKFKSAERMDKTTKRKKELTINN